MIRLRTLCGGIWLCKRPLSDFWAHQPDPCLLLLKRPYWLGLLIERQSSNRSFPPQSTLTKVGAGMTGLYEVFL